MWSNAVVILYSAGRTWSALTHSRLILLLFSAPGPRQRQHEKLRRAATRGVCTRSRSRYD
jgi:hypothetical protein